MKIIDHDDLGVWMDNCPMRFTLSQIRQVIDMDLVAEHNDYSEYLICFPNEGEAFLHYMQNSHDETIAGFLQWWVPNNTVVWLDRNTIAA
jgi:hypothetical protein